MLRRPELDRGALRRPDPDRRALGWLAAVGLGYALALALTPHPPCIDLPQHVALGAVLRRLWDGDPATLEAFALNPATHNGGLHVLLALAAPVVPPELAARLLVAAYPPALLAGLGLALRALGLPLWRALLAAPALLGFSFGWGLINFCLGTALAWVGLGLVLRQLAAPAAPRALALALLSAALGLTHVMAMALFGLTAGVAALEWAWRARGPAPPRRLARAALALAPLALGCAYDLWVVSRHLGADAASYTTPPLPDGPSASLGSKIYLFGSLCAGLFGSYLDNALAWAAVALVGWMALRRGESAPAARGEAAALEPNASALPEQGEAAALESGETAPPARGEAAALESGETAEGGGAREATATGPLNLVSPFALTLAIYLALPAVVFNTHLIYQRLAQWVLLAALLALPSPAEAAPAEAAPPPSRPSRPARPSPRLGPALATASLVSRRLAPALAAASLVSTALHLALYTWELRGLDEVVGALPPAARSVGVIEQPRTRAVRMPTLTHAAALAVARGGLDDGFGFARWMGFPVVYRPGRRPPPQPSPSWEHDASHYAPRSALARYFPWVVVRSAAEGEPEGALLARLFGPDAPRVRVVRRAGRWAALDTRAIDGEGGPPGAE